MNNIYIVNFLLSDFFYFFLNFYENINSKNKILKIKNLKKSLKYRFNWLILKIII